MRPGGTYSFWIVSNRVYGYDVHYHNERTIPCMLPNAHCVCQREGLSVRWAGYLAVRAIPTTALYLIRITAGAFQNSPSLQAMDGKLRGHQIVLQRLGNAWTSPLQVAIVDPPESVKRPSKLPELNVTEALERIWGIRKMLNPDPNYPMNEG